MVGKRKYTQCGCPMGGFGLNLSEGSTPYSPIPANAINVVSITFCGSIFPIDKFFFTAVNFINWLNNVFVPDNGMQGAFYLNGKSDLMYTNQDGFCDGSIDLLDLSDVVFTMELSSENDGMIDFQPIVDELNQNYFVPENM